jgi:hypothetical protein
VTEQQVRARIAKLLAIYEKHPDTAEGKNALQHAKRLMEKYKLDQKKERPEPDPSHPLAGLTTAVRDLFSTRPDKKATPDIGELDRRLHDLLRRDR